MKKPIRRQPTIPGVRREPSSTALLPEINRELKRLGRIFNVSPSWIRATILADALKIKAQPRYYLSVVKGKRRRAS